LLCLGLLLKPPESFLTLRLLVLPEVDEDLRAKLESNPLQNAPHLLRKVLGPAAETAFALALLASGQSSTMTGTYAGKDTGDSIPFSTPFDSEARVRR